MNSEETIIQSNERQYGSSALQFTSRVIAKSVYSKSYWLGISCAIFVFTVSGPFGTLHGLTWGERITFWAVVVTIGHLIALTIGAPFFYLAIRKNYDWIVAAGFAGFLAGIPCASIAVALGHLIPGFIHGTFAGYPQMFLVCHSFCIVCFFVHMLIARDFRRSAPVENVNVHDLRSQLEPHIRGEIVYLNAQGHYVKAVTQKGDQLLLMRLKNAIDLLPPQDGRQVHRSWWVSKDAIADVKRVDRKTVLTLKDGTTVPASRFTVSEIESWLNG